MSSKTRWINNFLSWVATRFTWVNDEGTWWKVRATWENSGGTWRCIDAALTASSQNVSDSQTGVGVGGTVFGVLASPAFAVDEVGTISFAWTHLSTSSGVTPGITDSTSASPTWSASVQDGTPSTSRWRLTVTDGSTGATAFTDITVTLQWFQDGP
jgi:hypothetical protein